MVYYPEGVKIILEADRFDDKSESGLIHFTEQTREENQRRATVGTVVAVGPDAVANFIKNGEKAPIEVGDRVVFSKYGGFQIADPEKDLRVILDEDIIALVI